MTSITDTDTGTYTYELIKEARERIAAMERHTSALLANYGPDHPWYTTAIASYGRCVGRILAFPMGPKTRVYPDSGGGSLNLYVISGDGGRHDIHMGVIFHAVRRNCTREGCRVYANDDGSIYSYNGTADPRCEDGAHEWLYPLHAPAPGTWSTHT